MSSYILLLTLFFYGTSQVILQEIKSNNDDLSTSFLHQKNGINSEKHFNYELNNLKINFFNRSKRARTRLVQFTVDDGSIQLNLAPIEYNVMPSRVPVWYTELDNNSYVFTKLHFSYIYPKGELFENFNKKAIMFSSERNNRYDYYGVFGEGNQTKVIQTNPDKNQFTHLKNYTDFGFHSYSPVLEVQLTLPNDDAKYILDNLKRFKIVRKPFDDLYVKLLVVVDYFYYEKFSGVNDILTYLSVFWNSVQLKYREIPFPNVKFIITGIIIARDPLKYIFDKYPHDPTLVNLHHFVKYAPAIFKTFGQNEKFYNFDNVVVMTNYTGFFRNRRTAGLASVGNVCKQTATFIKDNAQFGGLHEAAHELGHSLSMEHDRTSQTEEFGSIMYVTNAEANSLSWTKYDLANLYVFAALEQSWCLNTTFRNTSIQW